MPDGVIFFDDELERIVRERFGDEAIPEFLNMLRAGKTAYEHGYHGFISKEKFIDWVSKIYDVGEKRKQIGGGKELDRGNVIHIGNFLINQGRIQGYLSRQKRERTSKYD